MNLIYPVLAVTAGIFLSIQGPVNTALGRRTDKFQATLISFLGGTLLLTVIVLARGTNGFSHLVEARFWQLLGGLYGALGVCVSVAAIPVLGVALTLTVSMLGQLVMGTVIDRLGLFETAVTAVSPLRTLGILTVAAGILLIYAGSRERGQQKREKTGMLPMLLLTFCSGLAGAVQSPTNASLAALIGSWEGTLVSFAVGLLAIGIVTLARSRGRLKPMRGVGIRPWMLIGGAYGVAAIFLNLVSVTGLGAALQVACGMAGQLAGGIAVDSFGLFQAARVKINLRRAAGVAVILLGVVLITLARQQTQ